MKNSNNSSSSSSSSLILLVLSFATAVAASAYTTRSSSQQSNNNKKKKKKNCIYLDWNGTTPVYPQVLETMLPYLQEEFGNPSSTTHTYGTAPRLAIEQAKLSILHMIDASDDDDENLIMTGCGTEADNMAITLALNGYCTNNNSSSSLLLPHVVTTNVEHPAIEQYLQHLEVNNRVEVTRVCVNEEGVVNADDIASAIRDSTALVTVMWANNESGALMPISEIYRVCQQRRVLLHTDAAQAVGKVKVSSKHCDMMTIVGHKFGAPKGIACLYVKHSAFQNLEYNNEQNNKNGLLLYGGGQEHGRRAGTENVPYIAGMGKAASMVTSDLNSNAQHMERLRSRLLSHFIDELGEDSLRVNGHQTNRLPNTLNISFKGLSSGQLLDSIGTQVAASAGSACHSKGGGVSAVLKAMKVPYEFIYGTLRLSVGCTTTVEEVDTAAGIMISEIRKQWNDNNAT